ncbi:iron ABC transporter permease [Anaerocolumna aminovalerica]|mgnify:CR=1 FL=1|jgi:iron complex transport system permease protein|uniref:Iron complex transport system permease protein n=1 Tax=Anaerocolumna aminovalerica TaxID=1527 RepID=A0A1I5FDN3_9FIRM|nr:iron ABC transporter permease [Anaerocolumna aminovalerica]MBU5331776.1 iron ABC transporter permease [Anaerocolumna aminovalerica]MDU6264010.1 iron ABC transporter permease [Anaerocolumna aminovalerica]SFO21743.1 iron complex transport system permease protein [Anaerocolumna aminovalerica]
MKTSKVKKLGKHRNKNNLWQLIVLIFILILCIAISASFGSADLSVTDSLKIIASRIPYLGKYINLSVITEANPNYPKIVWQIRMPRILLAGFAGCGLSVVGAAFQGLFRNPLADPHILGVSSGAAVGATIAMLSGIGFGFLGLGVIGTFAFIGAILTAFIVYRLSCVGNKLPVVNILLTGTVVSTMLSSIISLLMTFNHDKIEKVYLWTMGSFSAATWDKVLFLAVFTVACCGVITVFSRELDVLTTGNDTAESLGINTARIKKILIIAASLQVGACVSVSGIIGFVGLVIPHCIRIISGSKHKVLLPLSGLGGAIFLIICDTIARNAVAPSEIPVGVITAMLGTPYFIYLLQRNKRREMLH